MKRIRAMIEKRTMIPVFRTLAVVTALAVFALSMVAAAPAIAGKVKAPPPQAPQGVTAAAIDPGVSIDWQPSAGCDIDGYYVYAGSKNNWKRLTKRPVVDNHYYDPDGVCGGEYAVSAVGLRGAESELAVVVAETASPVLYEESCPGVSVEGTWAVEAYEGASGGTIMVAGSSGAILRFRFTGRQFKLLAANYWSCGQANVYVDNEFVTRVDMYSGDTLFQQVEVSVPGLKYEEHVVTVLVLGYGNPEGIYNFVNIDAFEVR